MQVMHSKNERKTAVNEQEFIGTTFDHLAYQMYVVLLHHFQI